MQFNADQNYWASCYANEKFVIVQTQSGQGMTGIDHVFSPVVFGCGIDIDDETLGRAVIQALSRHILMNDT